MLYQKNKSYSTPFQAPNQSNPYGWSTNPPRITYPPPEIAGVPYDQGLMKTHWFPLIRPAIKPLSLGGVRDPGGVG